MALQAETPEGHDPQEVARASIPRAIRLLLLARGREQKDLAHYIDLTPQQLSDRLAGRSSFKAYEMAGIAAFLNVPVGDLYKRPEDLISTRWYVSEEESAGQPQLYVVGQGSLPGIR